MDGCVIIDLCVIIGMCYNPFIGQSAPAAADESVYSEVKPGSSLGNNATV